MTPVRVLARERPSPQNLSTLLFRKSFFEPAPAALRPSGRCDGHIGSKGNRAMIRKTILVLVAGAAIVTAAIASTHSSANSYGLNIGRNAYDSTYDFHKPAYSFGYRSYFVH
jgi:hypothetical protein